MGATDVEQQTITLTANNFDPAVNDVTCAFYNAEACADGDAINQPSWITSLSDNNSNQVTFNVADNNTSAARNVWMKVTATNGTESADAILPISQAKYVAEEASLPFTFTGGSADIPNTDGMSQSGLGTDYPNVTTKLKFDGTGDYVIIRLASAPGTLSYDIKGNSFSGGQFKIQESVDGTSYSDKASYSVDGTDIEIALTSTTRYVKFIYASKSSGNIGLGNIAISAYVEPTGVAAPTFSPVGGNFVGSVNVSLSQEANKDIYYTTDATAGEGDPSTSEPWLPYSSAIPLTETTTIYAAAKDGNEWSNVVSKTFTNTALTTMDAIFTAAGNSETDVDIVFNEWVVSGAQGKTAYVTDGTKGFVVFYDNHGFTEGDILSGTGSFKLKKYNGAAELTAKNSGTITITKGGVAPVQELTATQIDDLTGVNTGSVIKISGSGSVSSNKYYIDYKSEGKVQVYSTLYNFGTVSAGTNYECTGVYLQYNTTKEILPRRSDDLHALVCTTNPTLGATSVDGVGEEGVTLKSEGISAIGQYCEISSYGFEYSLNSEFPNNATTHIEVGTTYATANTAFEYEIASGLTPSTTYYVRAYATNGSGTAYAELENGFSTLASTAKVISVTPATSHDFEQVLTTANAQTWVFNVKGANLDENVAITGASAPITLSSSDLAFASVNGENGVDVTVTLTPNGAASVNQTLTLTSGTASATVTIQASVVAPYEVTFSVPAGLTAPGKQYIAPSQAANLNVAPTGSLAECTFLGWVSDQYAEQVAAISPLESYTPNGNATLYALFRRADTEDKNGYALSVVYSEETKYVGEYNSDKKNFSIASALADAEVFFLDEAGYIYAYINGAKSYLKSTGTNSSKADVGFAAKENSASWTITEGNPCTITANSGQTGRLFAYNDNNGTPRFAAYTSGNTAGYVYNITKTEVTKEVGTNYYSTAPVVPTLTGIEVTTAPTKTAYFAGDNFDPTGMVVKAHFSGGKADKIIAHSDLTITPSTNLTAGTTSVSISYGGQSITQAITVTAIALSSINLEGPTNTTYTQGDEFSTAGLVVNAVFNDETKNRALEANEYSVTTPDMSILGEQTVTVSFTFAGTTKTAEFTIQVNSVLQSISANTENVKMTYIEGEAFNPEGLVITATYVGGSSHTVTGYTCTPTGALKTIGELSNPATVQITVTYAENTTEVNTTFDVTVNPYPKRTVTFSINGNTETSVTETEAQGGIAKPSDPAGVGEYEFAGWSKTPRAVESIEDPELVEWPYYPTDDETLYAVYSHDAEAEIHGMYLTAEVDDNHTEKTIAYYNSNSLYPTDDGDHQAPLAMWFQDGLLFYMNGNNRTYVYNVGGQSNGANLSITAESNTASTYAWTKINNEDGTITFKHTDARILAWNTSYFRAYGNTYPFNKFTATEATETIVETVPYYTTSPSADVTPVLSFNEETPSIDVLDDSGNLNTYLNTLDKGGSTGSVTYSSSDETIATVANDGTVTAVKGGTVTITANVAAVPGSYKAASKSYTLTINKMTASASFGEPATTDVYVGNSIALPATSEDAITIIYSSSNTSYATVDAAGNVTGVSTDSYNYRNVTIYAEWEATDIYEASTNSTRAKVTVKVYDNAKTQTLSFEDIEKLFTPQTGDQTYTNVLSGAVTAVTYASNNTTFAEVDENTGEVTIHTNVDGSATITATAAASDVTESGITYHYAQAQASYVISLDYPRPTISIESGDIKAPISVMISSDEDMILYTLDGTTPSYANYNGEIYGSPIAISETTTLKAIAVSNTEAESPVATATYTKVLPTVTCNVADGGSVSAGTGAVTLTAAEDVLITYELVNSASTVLASGTNVQTPISLDVTMGSGYTLTILSQWNCENGFSTEEEITFNATGAGYLPIYYDNDKTNLPVYFTPTGLNNYGSADHSKIKFDDSGDKLVVQFANEPAKLSYTLKLNGSGTEYEFTVEESANGVNYSTVREHTNSSYQLTSNTEVTFNNIDLASTTRYIRWTYTSKPSGTNIGLGNIAITASNTGSITIDGVNVTEVPNDFQGDVTVVNGGTLNVTEDKNLTNLTVEAGGTISGSATLTVNDLTIESQAGKSAQVTNIDDVTVTGSLFMDVKLCDANPLDADYWYSIAVPFDVDLNSGVFQTDGTPMVNHTDFEVWGYNTQKRADTQLNGWERVTDNMMHAGKAYLIGFNPGQPNVIRLKAAADWNLFSGTSMSVTTTTSGGTTHDNWNGLANPTMRYIDVNADAQVFNNNSHTFDPFTYDAQAYNFVVGTAFFVQSSSAIAITNTDHGNYRAPQRAGNKFAYAVQITREGATEFDNQMIVRASEDATNAYEQGHDMLTMNNATSNTAALLWTENYGGKRLAIEEAPLVNNQAMYDLRIYAPAAGTYSLSAAAKEGADLYVTYNGAIIWNLSLGDYEMDLVRGTTTGYGLLLVVQPNQMPTGVENGELLNGENGVQKILLNGQLYILRDGHLYDAVGKEMK